MEIIRGLHNLRPEHRGCVMTIGNYDGVHRGHQAVLSSLQSEAQQRGLPVLVTVFEPTPREFFAPQDAPARLASLREKLEDLQRYGVERVLCLPFNQRLAQLPAEQFVQQVIVEGVAAEYVAVGDDFRFGRNRAGDFSMLQALGQQHGFAVAQQACVRQTEQRISSTAIRQHLADGEPDLAAVMLGRPYRISGRVQLGKQLARSLDMPTANIALGRHKGRKPAPRFGVYAITVSGLENETGQAEIQGVANLGVRPTVAGEGCLLEAHLFDYSGDLYGRRLSVSLQHFLRDEQRFASLDELKAAMHQDMTQARALLATA